MEPDRNDDHNVNFQVEIRSNIGLESDSRHSVVEILWIRLANEAGLSQKTRSAKWNGRGTDCLELHILFRTLNKQLSEIGKTIAERAGRLDGISITSFEEYLAHTCLAGQPYASARKDGLDVATSYRERTCL